MQVVILLILIIMVYPVYMWQQKLYNEYYTVNNKLWKEPRINVSILPRCYNQISLLARLQNVRVLL